MERRTSLAMPREALTDDELQMEVLVRERDWERAHARGRFALSTASRLHARLTAVVEAQDELREP